MQRISASLSYSSSISQFPPAALEDNLASSGFLRSSWVISGLGSGAAAVAQLATPTQRIDSLAPPSFASDHEPCCLCLLTCRLVTFKPTEQVYGLLQVRKR